jgi:hypothetical protein
MSVAEMKLELINKITQVDDERILNEVLSLLKNSKSKSGNEINLADNYDKIKEQYGDVLQKLAQ